LFPVKPETAIVLGYGVDGPFVVAGAPDGIVIAAEFENVTGAMFGTPNLKFRVVVFVPVELTTLIDTLCRLPQGAFAGTV
jgi:hypothetical protein